MKTATKVLASRILGSALLAPALFSCASPASRESRSPVSLPQVYVYESGEEGFNTKTFFYDTGREIVAFDTQFTPKLAREALAFLKTQTSRPLTIAVVTHPNPDKFNGVAEFRKAGAKIIASRATRDAIPGVHAYKKYYFVEMAKMFATADYPAEATIDETFEKTSRIRLQSGEELVLQELGQAGVSSNQTVARIGEAVFVGDLVHHLAHAWLEGGIVGGKATPRMSDWIRSLEELRQIAPKSATVYGGRGDSAPLATAVAEQVRYLTVADQLVSNWLRDDGLKAADLSGPRSAALYADLQVRFEREFADYTLGYMIGYGAYGLATSKL